MHRENTRRPNLINGEKWNKEKLNTWIRLQSVSTRIIFYHDLPFTHLPEYLNTYQSIYLSTYLPISLHTYLPTYTSTCIPNYLSIHPSTYQTLLRRQFLCLVLLRLFLTFFLLSVHTSETYKLLSGLLTTGQRSNGEISYKLGYY